MNGDTMDASGISMGNQFVWIPATEAELVRTEFNATGNPTAGLDALYTEPYASGYSGEASAHTTMQNQVKQYGGFYIGRFEAGIDNTTDFRDIGAYAQPVVCKRGVVPYSCVAWGGAMDSISSTDGAVYLANNFATKKGYTSVASTMCYGCQWDAMCRYIGDSQRSIATKSKMELTGSVAEDKSKNIYDLAGNCNEWTMEAYDTAKRVKRGGSLYSQVAISNRTNSKPSNIPDSSAFRLALYIK